MIQQLVKDPMEELKNAAHRARPDGGALALAWVLFATACSPAGGESMVSETTAAGAEPSTVSAPAIAPNPQPPAGHAWVIFGADTVVAEIAATADERSQGLMYREDVPDGTGMLFVFQQASIQGFWMANTYVPLDIAYMDSSYTIVDILQMKALDTNTYPSTRPAQFALEVREGWFAEHDIRVGNQPQIVFGVQGGR